ncbi:MAG: tetratricopeptide repeat protein [Bacteroidales bacterium]
MKRIILVLSLAFLASVSVLAEESVREERINIRKGNKVYEEQSYADAEVIYRKALEANPGSKIAAFNLATTLVRQSNGAQDAQQEDSPMAEAMNIFNGLASTISIDEDPELLSQVFYDLGNIAFNQQQYDESIKQYKNSLRINPTDEEARKNLRLAQLKKQEQQEQEQNQDENQDQQDENQDQDQQDQEQNQDENQEQEQEQNQDQQQQQEQQQQEQQQQEQQQGAMSSENIDQILKTMQNQEKDTQQKVNAEKMKQEEKSRRTINNQW